MASSDDDLRRLAKVLRYIGVPAKGCAVPLQNFGEGYLFIASTRILKVAKLAMANGQKHGQPAWSTSEEAFMEAMRQVCKTLPFHSDGAKGWGLYLKDAHAHLKMSELLLRHPHLFEGQAPQWRELNTTAQPKQTPLLALEGAHHSSSSSCNTRQTGASLLLPPSHEDRMTGYADGHHALHLGPALAALRPQEDLVMPPMQRPLQDSHVLGVRFIFDKQGRQREALALFQDLERAPSIYEADELRTADMRCCFCNRSLTVACFQAQRHKGSVKVHCLAHRDPSDAMFVITRDLYLLKDYVEDTRPLTAPDLVKTQPCVRRSNLNCGDAAGHVLTWDHLKDLLLGWGYSHLVHGATLIGFEPPLDKQGNPLDINPRTVSIDSLVDFIMNSLKRKKYFNTNMVIDTHSLGSTSSRLSDAVKVWRRDETTIKQGMMGTSKTSTTLFLLGGTGTFTDWHIDWSEATNYCMLLTGLEPDTTLQDVHQPAAVWWFLGPDSASVRLAEEWLAARNRDRTRKACPKRSFDRAAKEAMSEEDLEEMQRHVAGGGGMMLKVEQRPGDMVSVPPGWMHIVINRKACAKIAWDLFDDQHWANYLKTSHDLLAQVTKQKNAHDYMDVEEALLTQIKVAQQSGLPYDVQRRQTWTHEQQPSMDRSLLSQHEAQPSLTALPAPDAHPQGQGQGARGQVRGLEPAYQMLLQMDSEPDWYKDKRVVAGRQVDGTQQQGQVAAGGSQLAGAGAVPQGRVRRPSVKLAGMILPALRSDVGSGGAQRTSAYSVGSQQLLQPSAAGSMPVEGGGGRRARGSRRAANTTDSADGEAGVGSGAGPPPARQRGTRRRRTAEDDDEEQDKVSQRTHGTEQVLGPGRGQQDDVQSPAARLRHGGEDVMQQRRKKRMLNMQEADSDVVVSLTPDMCMASPGPLHIVAQRANDVSPRSNGRGPMSPDHTVTL